MQHFTGRAGLQIPGDAIHLNGREGDDLSGFVLPSESSNHEHYGLVIVGRVRLSLADLHFQYRGEIAAAGLHDDPCSRPNTRIIGSPLCRVLESYEARGLRKLLSSYRDTDYYRMFMRRRSLGYYINWASGAREPFSYSNEQIRDKIKKFVRIHQSIKQVGYLGRGFENRSILVLEAPYEVQRFGKCLSWRPYEIWSGHHRAASLVVNGSHAAEVILLRFKGWSGSSRNAGADRDQASTLSPGCGSRAGEPSAG
ncbi:MAG: hypothetical protein HYY96_06850 [Candidatus Tectomicrobia bacterium]|nr:hypothetical protein [Candidatus Tectomicrobia bacterium]